MIGNPRIAHAAQRNNLHSLAVPHGLHSMHTSITQFPTLGKQLVRGPSDLSFPKVRRDMKACILFDTSNGYPAIPEVPFSLGPDFLR